MQSLVPRIALVVAFTVLSCNSGLNELIHDKKPTPETPISAGAVKITESGGMTSVTEGGGVDTYSVALTSEPTANVIISINGGSQLTVSPTTLTFTTGACPGTGNWCNGQIVTVTAVDDALAESNHTGTIMHTATSTDSAYNSIAISSVTVSITDNESPGVSITESAGSTTAAEGGGGDTYTIVLTVAPANTVSIALNGGSQLNVTPTPLTFTAGACPGPGNWCTAQTVTVNAVDDASVEGNHSGAISHTATSSDAGYSGIAIANISASISDNDGPSPIYLFKTATTTMGLIGGRTGADTLCTTARGLLTFPNNTCATVKAFISISNTGDDIAGMAIPGERTVNGPTGIQFQNDWTDLLNGVETTTAADAGILPAATLWWSFSSTAAAGLPAAQNCTNGTSTSGNGRAGQSDVTGGSFYNIGGSPPSCGTAYYLLCLCY